MWSFDYICWWRCVCTPPNHHHRFTASIASCSYLQSLSDYHFHDPKSWLTQPSSTPDSNHQFHHAVTMKSALQVILSHQELANCFSFVFSSVLVLWLHLHGCFLLWVFPFWIFCVDRSSGVLVVVVWYWRGHFTWIARLVEQYGTIKYDQDGIAIWHKERPQTQLGAVRIEVIC